MRKYQLLLYNVFVIIVIVEEYSMQICYKKRTGLKCSDLMYVIRKRKDNEKQLQQFEF